MQHRRVQRNGERPSANTHPCARAMQGGHAAPLSSPALGSL
eukprot:CAMPEP_0177661562 /NCGR_PEP_ID=MMETSP0447-20121125/18767_1 /TAXON_ID=0 /ORGANISM="Stygamoeba regulata, Strain BSH-02190019" /LENGTH=40 /DNA_ID= /DNA_START= /DNA_END= /DNA_ORIENTATION=